MNNQAQLPDYLQKFNRDPEEILGDRVLPPQRNTGSTGMPSVGRRTKYETPTALQFAVDRYYDKMERLSREPTLPGMALALGFPTKHAFRKYGEHGEEFQHVVDTAITRLEERRNESLIKGGPATQGIIFDLKNTHHWADKMETNLNVAPTNALAELVASLQGKILRPALAPREPETIEDAEYYDVDDDDNVEDMI